ncbi:hypothetical protein DL766_002654 [Monosporascus sp. MC13-8B]|uniref:Uncharacterized protein n=1 Tax=Monosporascus cannonballus TaxID=155416 RepID=A0ABY0HCX4_9PEZI|nr:hypothetical protein DL762_003036 [Monosporascus cannonballus]RYP35207.1 hypothetical protein DL766_002654 [Monosporascus sp. MC13-8B]
MAEPPTQIVEEQSESEEESPQQTQVLSFDPSLGPPTDSAHERRYRTRTPEPQKRQSQKLEVQRSPNSEGQLAPFDWDEFEARYEKALNEADEREKELLEEFDRLVKYFNAWASASSAHDDERAVKRLQTRERYVRLSERQLMQKKQHLAEVVKAFQRAFQVPEVSQAEIDSFREFHFSHAAVELFKAEFLMPENAPDNERVYDGYEYHGHEEEEDDGLGYYPDGVKRTLTDEQIAIFRHSEIESLRRAQSKADKAKAESAAMLQVATVGDQTAVAEDDNGELRAASEDGELESEKPTAADLRRMKRKRAKQSKKGKRKFQPEPKEDLRKRTWDKVEAGMDSLDYDGLEAAHDAASHHMAQRRRISYED